MSDNFDVAFNFDDETQEKKKLDKKTIKLIVISILSFFLLVFIIYRIFFYEKDISIKIAKIKIELKKLNDTISHEGDFFSSSVNENIIKQYINEFKTINIFKKWQKFKKKKIQKKVEKKIEKKVEEVKQEESIYKLNGFVTISNTKYAIIENQFYKLGQNIDDYTVMKIGSNEVVLYSEINDEEIVLNYKAEQNYGIKIKGLKSNNKKNIINRIMKR